MYVNKAYITKIMLHWLFLTACGLQDYRRKFTTPVQKQRNTLRKSTCIFGQEF